MAQFNPTNWKPPEYWAKVDPNARKDPEKFPGWRFGPNGGAGLFKSDEEVPEGWTDNPNDHTEEAALAASQERQEPELPLADDLGRDAVIEALDAAKVEYNPRWTTSRLNKLLRESKVA